MDYHHLNTAMWKDAHPFPHIDDSLNALNDEFFTLDLASGYWQITLSDSVKETLFQFMVMQFGLCNMHTMFDRLMSQVLRVSTVVMLSCVHRQHFGLW